MRTIGIDLAISGQHYAMLADETGEYVGRPFPFEMEPAALDTLLRRAQGGSDHPAPVRVVMEPTGLSWLAPSSYFIQRGVTVYLVNSQQAADLRKFYRKHAKSDRISARVLVRLPWVNGEALHPLCLAGADYLAGQRWCKQQEVLAELITAVENRVQAWERAFWPGLEQVVGDLFAAWVCRWREVWYDPWQLAMAEPHDLTAFLVQAGAPAEEAETIAAGLQGVARRAVALFGTPCGDLSPYVDYVTLQEQVLRELRLRAMYAAEHQVVRQHVQQLYRRLHPTRALETIRGVGEDGAAVYFFFIHDVERFLSQKHFRGWHGMVPESDQSGDLEKKGLRMTAAGPDPVKKYAYINAEVARQWDPQIAAVYYDQMVHKGKHHIEAVCICATHLLDRVRAVLRDGQPYQLRDVDGRPITWQEARAIVLERYQVPEDVRRRTSQRARKERRDRRAERKQLRRSRPAR